MTVYLCTCGTSAAKKLPRDPRFDASWVELQGGIENAAKRIFSTFRAARMSDETALMRDLSAEIHSLARMQLSERDTVVLFSSETPDGQACARAVRMYLEQEHPEVLCRVDVVPGLQVMNADLFRASGVVNFTKAVLKEIDGYGAAQCVLNPTGGFKSLVPYTVLIGMLKGVAARYIFERSTRLIALPMMPVEFARSRLEPVRSLLERIQIESAVARAEFEQVVPFEDRLPLEPLFEEIEPGMITLSPVGLLVWEELNEPSALVPFLSRRAFDDLRRIRSIEGCKPQQYIQRVARSPEQLESSCHECWSQGLFWLKPGQHTRDRYLVSVEGWRLLVWRIVDHDEYDDMLDQNRKGDAGARLVAERGNQYAPFVRFELYED